MLATGSSVSLLNEFNVALRPLSALELYVMARLEYISMCSQIEVRLLIASSDLPAHKGG